MKGKVSGYKIHQHILSRRKGNGSRAEKAEYQVPLEGSTNEKQALKWKHEVEGEKKGGKNRKKWKKRKSLKN